MLDVLPASGPERANALKRLRTEIMAGEGPDVFIMLCAGGFNSGEAFFQVPEKAMKNGLFLPLYEYLENAQFMEWDKQTAVIMAVGRDEYGQQLLPMAYTLPLTYYRASDIESVKPGAETTWDDMLADEPGCCVQLQRGSILKRDFRPIIT
ncbi:MAG: hypothetical protein J6I98_04790 [Clostridia bacterium]|nr:hypothetical protein [Clostridia bacterium]